MDKGIIYYTDNRVEEPINTIVQQELLKVGLPIISVSLKPLAFGKNIVIDEEPGVLTMYRQIYAGLQASTADVVFLCEHDVLYHPSHFDFTPPQQDVFYYNVHNWRWDYPRDRAITYTTMRSQSGLCVYRLFALAHYKKRIEIVEKTGWKMRYCFEPGTRSVARGGISDDTFCDWRSAYPNIDIRHRNTLSTRKVTLSGFKHPPQDGSWKESVLHKIPGWNLAKLFNLKKKWYQEAIIDGVAMPKQRTKDTNERRWCEFIKPLLPPRKGLFVDLGCNAGFYMRNAVDEGYRALGVEIDDEYVQHAHYWEKKDPKGVEIVQADISTYDIPACTVALLANVHYWLTPKQLARLIQKLQERACMVLVVGRNQLSPIHESPCDVDELRKQFIHFKEVTSIHGEKHYSILFKNPYIISVTVNTLWKYQQLSRSQWFVPAFSELIDDDSDPLHSSYYRYLQRRIFTKKIDARATLLRHVALIKDVKRRGITRPLLLGRMKHGRYSPLRLDDGDHRLILAKKLGIQDVICKVN